MASHSQSKADERRERNLASAKASRQRRREQISALTQERARLNEANALLRNRLHISDSAVLPAFHQFPPSSSSSSSPPVSSLRGRQYEVELGPAMQQIIRRREMDGKAVVDLLDRAVSGSKGMGPPLDADAAAKLAQAARKMPPDVKRPLSRNVDKPLAKPKTSTTKVRGQVAGKKRQGWKISFRPLLLSGFNFWIKQLSADRDTHNPCHFNVPLHGQVLAVWGVFR